MMKRNVFTIRDAGYTYLWAIIAPQIILLVAQIFLIFIATSSATTPEALLESKLIYLPYVMLTQVAFMFVIFYFSKGVQIKQAVRLNYNFGINNILICILIAVICLFGLSPLANVFSLGLESIGYNISSSLISVLDSPLMLIVGIILFAGVPAIVEEILFRGIIFQGLKSLGITKAILITSALFALIHCSAEQLVFPFLLSIILCYVVLKTGSLLASIIVHFVSNSISLLLSYFKFEMLLDFTVTEFTFIAIGFAILVFVLVYLISKLLKNKEKGLKVDNINNADLNALLLAKKDNGKVLNISVIVVIVIWLINFAYYMSI